MPNPKCACGRPLHHGVFCPACALRLSEAIASVSAYRGLAWDLEIAQTRQDRINRRPGRPDPADVDDAGTLTLHPTAFPYAERAGDAGDALRQVLARWAALAAAEAPRPPRCGHCRQALGEEVYRAAYPPVGLADLATWMRPRVGWLRNHRDGQAAHEEILAAVRAARAAVDRPPELTYVGPCETCQADMYVRPGAEAVECADCGEVYAVDHRREWLLAAAEDVLATASEIARAITNLGEPVTAAMIRGYAHRGRLAAHGDRTVGGRKVPVYRVGDVLDILATAS